MAVTDEAIEKIKQMIVAGELRPGDRLPREADLSGRLGLSRSSLREAVKALTLINVLNVRQGDGTYVTSLEPALLLESLSFVVDLHRDDTVLQFFEVRRLLEPAATALAAQRMGSDEIAELRCLLDRLGDSPTVDDLVANDLEFHRRIVAGAGNPVLASMVDTVSATTQRARIWRGLTQADAVAATLREHRAIAASLAARDPDGARAWATVHIGGVERWLTSAIPPTAGVGPSTLDAIRPT
ncbi:FadR/GntR family transcriptional regulator [Jiangella alba]|uniref:DNA-binding transcriptional regulator, FadR family n=1 Tax=Jiangella alba TaxID=561176 RepID=A0A1H5HJQ9_9ACTN|nr:FadR/GntR family transcriptional regulator [Jiangella alba]SEE28004.1 DNA-binding transcriptional regulator, FadR family [Jiangella alba]